MFTIFLEMDPFVILNDWSMKAPEALDLPGIFAIQIKIGVGCCALWFIFYILTMALHNNSGNKYTEAKKGIAFKFIIFYLIVTGVYWLNFIKYFNDVFAGFYTPY